MKHLTAAHAALLKSAYPSGALVDNHRFERDAMAHPNIKTAFAFDFLEHISKPDPLHSFSMEFGRWIQRELSGQIVPTQRIVSLNLRNDNRENQEWRIL